MLRNLPSVFTLILIVPLCGSYLIILFHKSGNWGLQRSECLSKTMLVSFGAKSGAHDCLMRPGLLGEHSSMSRFGDSMIVQLYFTGYFIVLLEIITYCLIWSPQGPWDTAVGVVGGCILTFLPTAGPGIDCTESIVSIFVEEELKLGSCKKLKKETTC